MTIVVEPPVHGDFVGNQLNRITTKCFFWGANTHNEAQLHDSTRCLFVYLGFTDASHGQKRLLFDCRLIWALADCTSLDMIFHGVTQSNSNKKVSLKRSYKFILLKQNLRNHYAEKKKSKLAREPTILNFIHSNCLNGRGLTLNKFCYTQQS